MQSPESRWRPSARSYEANPPRWEYPAGARVLKVDSRGKVTLAGQNWPISAALAGGSVDVMPVRNRMQDAYQRTPIPATGLGSQRSPLDSPVLARPAPG